MEDIEVESTEIADGDSREVAVLEKEEDFVPDMQPISAEDIEDEMSKFTSDEIKLKIIDCRNNIEHSYWELCKCLYYVEVKRLYESWGYSSFHVYVAKELTYQKSKARYLVQIWKALYINQPDKTVLERVLTVGWTKAKELIHVITSDNADYWIEKATHLNVEELKKEVKATLAKNAPTEEGKEKEVLAGVDAVEGTPQENATKNINFSFSYQDFVAVTEALDRVKTEIGGSNASAGQALALICGDYLSTNPVELSDDLGEEDKHRFAINSIRKYETMSGLEVIILDPQTEEVVYGGEYLKKLLANG